MRVRHEHLKAPVSPERRAELDAISRAVEAELPEIVGRKTGVNFHDALAFRVLMHRLRAVREQKGLTLDAAATAVGMDKAQLSRLEAGQGNPTVQTVERVARGYGFQVLFSLQNNETGAVELPGLVLAPVAPAAAAAKFELELSVAEWNGGLELTWTYNTDLFDAATIERLGASFDCLLRGIVADPSRPLCRLPGQGLTERRSRPFPRTGAGSARQPPPTALSGACASPPPDPGCPEPLACPLAGGTALALAALTWNLFRTWNIRTCYACFLSTY